MIALLAWFVIAEAAAFGYIVVGLPLVAAWCIVAGAWACVQYDDGWARR